VVASGIAAGAIGEAASILPRAVWVVNRVSDNRRTLERRLVRLILGGGCSRGLWPVHVNVCECLLSEQVPAMSEQRYATVVLERCAVCVMTS